jgi:SMODS-associated and fused to various effectors sensor domain
MGRIPLAVHLGYVLGDRARAFSRHYDRYRCTWSWNPEVEADIDITYKVERKATLGDARIRVSLSAQIDPSDLPPASVDVSIAIPNPGIRWLAHPDQLIALRAHFDNALADLRSLGAQRIHLCYAGPTAGAIEFGRAYNPRMNPPLHLYEYARSHYDLVLLLNPA